jgi:hypothetical protein
MTFLQQIEQNSAEIRRLLAVPTVAEVGLALTGFGHSVDISFASIAQPPIGAIIAWHRNATLNVPSLPANWVACSGGVFNDPESPLNGMTLPNLNDGDFLRGATQSGGGGGAATHIHNFSAAATISAEAAGAVSGADIGVSLDSHDHPVVGSTDPESSLPPYFEVLWIIRIK